MNVESLREFCLSLPQVLECFLFDEWVLVFKIEGKMFLFCDLSGEEKRISPSNAIPNPAWQNYGNDTPNKTGILHE